MSATASRHFLSGPRWILALLGVALFALPLGLHRPGLPVALKADEPAYFLASLSLVHDLDLRVEEADLRRLFELYPYLRIENLIVMSDDGWRTLYYGKPFLVSFLAAPLVLHFGSAGPLLLNLLLFFAMICMGSAWLVHRGAGEGLAIFFSAGFFLLASAWSYVFWIHPEVLLMFSTCGCLFFGLGALDAGDGDVPPWTERLGVGGSLALSAAILALGVYNKPMLAAMGLPICFGLLRRGAWRGLAAWVGSAVAAMAAICALSWALTGQPTAYLVDLRAGFLVHDPTDSIVEPLEEISSATSPAISPAEETAGERPGFVPEVAKAEDVAPAGWWWLLRWPETRGFEVREDLVYFFLGRHTGLFVYAPFALLALLFFAFHGLCSVRAWSILLSLALVAAFFLLWIPFNWHGGGGFVGNRYFVMVYPAFLFLVERLRPTRAHGLAVAVFWALGGWLTGPLLLAPFGLMAPAATLQIHARAAPHQLVPMDFSLRTHPGYGGMVQEGVYVWGRKDQIDALRGSDVAWLRGAEEVDVWLISEAPLERIELELSSPVAQNAAVVRFGGEERHLELGKPGGGPRRVVFDAPRPSKVRRERRRTDYHAFQDIHIYHLAVETARGRVPEWDAEAGGGTSGDETPFYRGASLRFVGSRAGE